MHKRGCGGEQKRVLYRQNKRERKGEAKMFSDNIKYNTIKMMLDTKQR
nr:MAG TPA: hypothetical protein [Caudoviricetes sp.]